MKNKEYHGLKMQYKRTTFTFHPEILGKKCMLTELTIYIVSNGSELWTKASLKTEQVPIVTHGKLYFKE